VRVLELFGSRSGGTADGVWFAPGRANLMGEHTDYNEGYVLPFALGQGIVAAAARLSGPRRLTLCSAQEPGAAVEVMLDDLSPGRVSGWAAYPAGVAWALAAAGYHVPGAFLAFDSDLPEGAGLSSSAALECATALALTELAGLAVDRRELAAIARRAENDFAGAPTGIMDQSASLLSRRGHALLLDCRSLESTQVPFDPAASGAGLLVIDTRAKHEHSASEYGRRRAECEQAAVLLGIPSLRYLTDVADVDRLSDPVLRRRARHVVTDDQRVLAVVGLLTSASADAYPQVGRLLTQAHLSLRDDFEISWPEADAAVDAALAAGALGARMIGGGFGGSVLALVRSEAAVRSAVAEAFGRRGWTAPEFLVAVPSDSARRIGLG
jgi:galactokinase